MLFFGRQFRRLDWRLRPNVLIVERDDVLLFGFDVGQLLHSHTGRVVIRLRFGCVQDRPVSALCWRLAAGAVAVPSACNSRPLPWLYPSIFLICHNAASRSHPRSCRAPSRWGDCCRSRRLVRSSRALHFLVIGHRSNYLGISPASLGENRAFAN